MGILTALRSRKASVEAGYLDPSTLPIATPWSSSTLQRIVAEDVFGSDLPLNTRAGAMRLPAVKRARGLVVSSIARNPLVAMRREERVDPQPSWLMSAAGGTSPQHRNAWTVDDLMFYGVSCWFRANGADGFPVQVGRINFGDWEINEDNRVEVQGEEMPDDAVILFTGLDSGLLVDGVEALRDIRTLYENVRKRLASPLPPIELHQTGGVQLKDDEIDSLIDRWVLARQGKNGGVGYTSQHIEAKVLATNDDGQLMIESRNAAAVDAARLVGLSAGLVDATTPKASLNYETKQGRNEEFIDRDLAFYMDPIAWRLSLDDVTPRGQRVTWDTAAFTDPDQPATGPNLED